MFRALHFGCAVLVAGAVPAVLSAGTNSLEEFSQTYALSAHGRISLENLNGDVRITSWDRDEVKVEAVKRAPDRERLGDARIVVDAAGDALSIRTHYTGASEDPASVEYRITVPRQASLEEVKLINGGLSIVGVAGDVNASAVNGSIHAEQLAGEARLSTVNGELEAAFHSLGGTRAIFLTSVNGPITLSLPPDARASLNARNLSGGIRSEFGRPLRTATAGGQRLHTTIKGGGTRIHLHNINGGISITGPARRGRES
jgi:DUF4097 and DUF4098 domain-containing protein YvlB